MQWVQGHQQVMLVPSEWLGRGGGWDGGGRVFTSRGKTLLGPGLHSSPGRFIVTQAPPLPGHPALPFLRLPLLAPLGA